MLEKKYPCKKVKVKVQVYSLHPRKCSADCTIASPGQWACHNDTKLSVSDTFKSATQQSLSCGPHRKRRTANAAPANANIALSGTHFTSRYEVIVGERDRTYSSPAPRPGIEPGPLGWQASILPLDYWLLSLLVWSYEPPVGHFEFFKNSKMMGIMPPNRPVVM